MTKHPGTSFDNQNCIIADCVLSWEHNKMSINFKLPYVQQKKSLNSKWTQVRSFAFQHINKFKNVGVA